MSAGLPALRAAMPTLALRYATSGWPIFPLNGKVPAIPTTHPEGDPLRGVCRGDCGRDGHGVLDATTDPDVITRWWNTYRTANVGLRPLPTVTVIDIDPRGGGDLTWRRLTAEQGPTPPTLTVMSGRGDGGGHLYFRTPGSLIASGAQIRSRYGPGIDIKTHRGYVVAAGSIHPDTNRPYWMRPGPQRPTAAPQWLLDLLGAPPVPARAHVRPVVLPGGQSIADDYGEAVTWPDVLTPHGWRCVGGDGDSDGSRWKHPTATSAISATVRNGCLFVYSPNTPLPVTEVGAPAGVTKFRAYAHLNHHGDMSAAARHLATARRQAGAA